MHSILQCWERRPSTAAECNFPKFRAYEPLLETRDQAVPDTQQLSGFVLSNLYTQYRGALLIAM